MRRVVTTVFAVALFAATVVAAGSAWAHGKRSSRHQAGVSVYGGSAHGPSYYYGYGVPAYRYGYVPRPLGYGFGYSYGAPRLVVPGPVVAPYATVPYPVPYYRAPYGLPQPGVPGYLIQQGEPHPYRYDAETSPGAEGLVMDRDGYIVPSW